MKRNIFVFMFVVLALFLGFVYVTGCGTGSTGGGTPVSVPDIYVSITGSDTTGEGTESNPYRTINKAMSVATTGDIILVKNGLYNDGTITWSPTVEGITLRGESKELTTLEGSSAVIDLFDIVASQTVVIENLTITGGTISGDGGGIGVNTDINLTVKNSILSNNKARIGGAIFFDSSGSLSLENCTFLNNDVGSQDNGTSRNGGAVFAGSGATLTALNCSFVGNVAMSTSTYIRGGAVCFEGDANFTNCAFTSNSSSKEGGAIYSGSGAAKIYKCFFKGNNSGGSGGAIYCSPSYASEIVNCILILNEAGTAATGNGGAIYAVGSGTLEVINCTVVSNECNNWGGGISDYDNVIIASGVKYGKWTKNAQKYLSNDFGDKKVAVFISSAYAGETELYKHAYENYLVKVIEEVPNLKPVVIAAFGGRIPKDELPKFAKGPKKLLPKIASGQILTRLHENQYDNRDWDKIREWAHEVGKLFNS